MDRIGRLRKFSLQHRPLLLVVLTVLLVYLSFSLYLALSVPYGNQDPPCSGVVQNDSLYISEPTWFPENPFNDTGALLFITRSDFHWYGAGCDLYSIEKGESVQVAHSKFTLSNSRLNMNGKPVEPGMNDTRYSSSAEFLFIDTWKYYSTTVEIKRVRAVKRYEIMDGDVGQVPQEGRFDDEVIVVRGSEHNRSHFSPFTLILYLVIAGFFGWLWFTVLSERTETERS